MDKQAAIADTAVGLA
ncbi:hypothetical protein RRG08_042265, partial [Elysia crispata]